jgi:hypothetical protein
VSWGIGWSYWTLAVLSGYPEPLHWKQVLSDVADAWATENSPFSENAEPCSDWQPLHRPLWFACGADVTDGQV